MSFQDCARFDRYKILEHIAQDGMGDVYHSVDILAHSDGALKIPTRGSVIDPAKYDVSYTKWTRCVFSNILRRSVTSNQAVSRFVVWQTNPISHNFTSRPPTLTFDSA